MSGPGDQHCEKASRSSGPYGTPAYKVPPTKKNKHLSGQGTGSQVGWKTDTLSGSLLSLTHEELTDTAWPLEKTLHPPRTHRPSVKGDEILKTDPGSLARQSINMIYTPKPSNPSPDQPKPASSPPKKKETPPPPPPEPEPEPVKEPTPEPVREPTPEPVKEPTPAPPTPSPSPPPPPPPPPPKPEVKKYAGLAKARARNEFDPLLECPQCKKRISEPKVACCLRMCQSCLQRDIHARESQGVLPGKVCGDPIPIPDTSQSKSSWAKQFETDPFLSHLQEAIKQLEGKQQCYVCRSRLKITDTTHYCFDCASCYCMGCTEQHRHMPTHKHHRVKALDHVSAADIMKLKKRFCPSHEGMPLDLFCTEHQEPMCGQCAATVHQSCGAITTVVKVANEKKDKLRSAEKVLQVGINKCDHHTKKIQNETAEVDQLKQQTMDEIDGSFTQVIQALETRRNKLKKDIEEHFRAEAPQYQETQNECESVKKSMQSRMDLVMQMIQHASDFDILSCADNLHKSAENMAPRNVTVSETPRPKVIVKVDDRAVHNFMELVSLLGAEVGSTQVKGMLLKKITTKMKGDQHTPEVRDILLAAESHLVAVDNRNQCVKTIQIVGDSFITKRLQLKTEPWGGTKLQPSMIAVTGLKVIYIITITDQLALQSTVKTRKDYWGICAITPINLACSCKYPPGVDIVDITGRRLRSIDVDQAGDPLFEMPGYLAMNGDNILVTDRAKKCLTCVDQQGKVVFVYHGQGEERLAFPRGICVDRKGRIYVADHDRSCVHLLNRQGEYLCLVMNVPKPRTLCLDHNGRTLYLSTEGKGISFFNMIEVET